MSIIIRLFFSSISSRNNIFKWGDIKDKIICLKAFNFNQWSCFEIESLRK